MLVRLVSGVVVTIDLPRGGGGIWFRQLWRDLQHFQEVLPGLVRSTHAIQWSRWPRQQGSEQGRSGGLIQGFRLGGALLEALLLERLEKVEENIIQHPDGLLLHVPVWKSKFYGAFASTSTPSTRCLLDGMAMLIPHRSTEPGWPREHPTHWLISTQVPTSP